MAATRLSVAERLLRLFTDVRPGEGSTALLMVANVFLILCAYYLVKPLREGWIAISGIPALSKMEVKAYSSFGQSLLLIAVVRAYGRLSERRTRSGLVIRATLFCMSNLLLFWLLQPDFFMRNLPGTGIAFYLWVGMFGVFVVAQFWAFAADFYSDERGRRLIPLIAIGATAGAAAGSGITEVLVGRGVVPTEYLLLVALVPLAASAYLTRLSDVWGPLGAGGGGSPAGRVPPPAARGQGALDIVARSPLLLAVAAITVLMNWVNTNGENLLFRVVQEVLEATAASRGFTDRTAVLEFIRDGTTVFYGNFFLWVNGVALVLQAFVASRLLRYGGFAVLLLMLPVVAFASYTTMALVPVLAVVKFMKVAENSTDYSINNTARHVLWLPTTAEMKYKGKPAIDTLFARLGDGLSALTVMIGVHLLAFGTVAFFWLNVTLVVVWLAIAVVVIREHGHLTAAAAAADVRYQSL
jgi:AAA family ATP:ADP antiporter